MNVLFERVYSKNKEFFEGKTENYITVAAMADNSCEGKILRVKIEKAEKDILFGSIV